MTTLRDLRLAALLTQAELAAKIKVTPETISRLETGVYPPRLKTIRKLARALKVEPGEIEFAYFTKEKKDE